MNYFKNISIFDLQGEYWKPIQGYEDIYEYSNYGRIKSISKILPCKGGVNSYDILKRKSPRPWLGKTGKDNFSSKKIICVDTGEIFYSGRILAEKIGVCYQRVSVACKKEGSRIKGLAYKYVTK